jgi:hypothetical protein
MNKAELLVEKSKKLAYMNAAQQQGTTRVIYDSLPIDGTNTFRFFEGANSRQYPNTNLNANQLGIDETMLIQHMYFHIKIDGDFVETRNDEGEILTTFKNCLSVPLGLVEILGLFETGLFPKDFSIKLFQFAGNFNCSGQMDFTEGTSEIIKNLPMRNFSPFFNKTAYNQISNIYKFENNLILMPLVEFKNVVRTFESVDLTFTYVVATVTKTLTARLFCTIEGLGTLISPTKQY